MADAERFDGERGLTASEQMKVAELARLDDARFRRAVEQYLAKPDVYRHLFFSPPLIQRTFQTVELIRTDLQVLQDDDRAVLNEATLLGKVGSDEARRAVAEEARQRGQTLRFTEIKDVVRVVVADRKQQQRDINAELRLLRQHLASLREERRTMGARSRAKVRLAELVLAESGDSLVGRRTAAKLRRQFNEFLAEEQAQDASKRP